MDIKFCPRCEITKSVSEFYLNKGRSDGLSGYCVECQRSAENERRLRARLKLIEDLGGECKRCGFRDPRALQIDHVNGDGAVDRIEFPNTNNARFYKEVRENPDRYMLMCANCNWIKRHEQMEVVGRRMYARTPPKEKRQGEGRWSQAVNARRSEAMKRHQRKNPDVEAARAEKMRKKATGRKLVTGDDGKRHWVYPDATP